jgi:hypothetical protein
MMNTRVYKGRENAQGKKHLFPEIKAGRAIDICARISYIILPLATGPIEGPIMLKAGFGKGLKDRVDRRTCEG